MDDAPEHKKPEDAPEEAIDAPANLTIAQLRRQQRMVMSELLSTETAWDVIVGTFQRTYGLRERQVRALQSEVYADWKQTDEEQRPYRRAAARRRLLVLIKEARKAKKYSAIANLEKLLADIEGTRETIDVTITTDARLSDALMRKLGGLTDRQAREIIDREIQRLDPAKCSVAIVPRAAPPETIANEQADDGQG